MSQRLIATPTPWVIGLCLGTLTLLLPAWWDPTFTNPRIKTGWILFALLTFLGALNFRKKLSMLPLAPVSTWYAGHVVGGILSLLIFWGHASTPWPQGFYERLLAILFYLVILTGILGVVLQKIYPSYLTQSGIEVIYERIPHDLAHIRAQAEETIEVCTRETGCITLARYYLENFAWFFDRPRFFGSHIFTLNDGKHWVQLNTRVVRRYLDPKEQAYLDRLHRLAMHKNDLDSHYALQGLLKSWLSFHVPFALAMMLLVIWHVILINVYVI